MLCYNFFADPENEFVMIREVMMEVMDINEVSVDAGSKDTVVIGVEKTFFFAGSGLRPGDDFKFVRSSVSNDFQCDTEKSVGAPRRPKPSTDWK